MLSAPLVSDSDSRFDIGCDSENFSIDSKMRIAVSLGLSNSRYVELEIVMWCGDAAPHHNFRYSLIKKDQTLKHLMVKSGLSLLIALLLLVINGLGTASPVAAQPLPFTPSTAIAETTTGGPPLFSFSGQKPTNLGVKDGKLAPCPSTPNCVSSQAPASDSEHAIEPIAYVSSPTQALSNLKSIIQSLPRTQVVNESGSYIYAEFKSALMGFVDDVEFYLDEGEKVIHVRSASRLGKSDLGVNRKRIEAIRAKFAELESQV